MQVENQGSGPTPDRNWYDQLSVRDDTTNRLTSKNVYHGTAVVEPNTGYVGVTTMRTPEGVSGNQTLTVIVDRGNVVYENLKENNQEMSVKFEIILAPPPDFEAVSVVVPTSALPAAPFTVTFTVKNQGWYRTY